MGLRVWLPLNGDLRNNGLDDVTVTNNGAIVDDNGKIGKCYNFNGSNSGINISGEIIPVLAHGDFSVAFWIYSNDLNDRSIYLSTIPSSGYGLGIEKTVSEGLRIYWQGSPDYYPSFMIPDQEWCHIIVVIKNSNCYCYKNGILTAFREDGTFSPSRLTATWNYAMLGRDLRTGNTVLKGKINDFRWYDHALSLKEIKDISKGLVLHYPLNRGELGASNLIKNGFGELNHENWNNSTNISTTDIPSDQSDIKASFSNGTTLEHIKIYPTHTYKFSAWIKATTTSGNVYPSLYPYDIDKKFIANYNCPDGFNQNTMTTLTQQLKSGDTKIYVNDLSNWNANSGHYYNLVAIFSYTDSTGYTYPDGQYTQNCVRFGSGTNAKTNLDKTNNIITLNTAYTGRTMPVGTKVCASAEGSTNYYPLGGFNLANIQDWTYKENTFSGGINRLKYAKTVVFWTYYNNRMAGIKFEDITANELTGTIEYDTSGLENNGTMVGTFSWGSNTPRYDLSTKFNGAEYIDAPITCGSIPDAVSVSCWGYEDNWNTQSAERLIGAATGSSGWCIGDYGSENTLFAFYADSSYNVATGFKQLTNGWHHFAITFDGLNLKYYVDGQEYYSKTFSTKQVATGNYNISIGRHRGGGCYFKGLLSDVRIYATALSADDVKSLYQVTVSADKNNNFYSYSYNELNQGNEIEYLYDLNKFYGTGNFYQDKDGLHLDQNVWVTHDYIPIDPSEKTYKYDIELSCDTGNLFYIGWERYDVDKTSRSNNACTYVYASSTERNHYRIRGTVNLSTDGVNPCAFIKLRILNKWTGSDSETNGTAIIHYLSLKEYSDTTVQNMTPLKINKQGIVNTTEILEKDIGVSVDNVYELNSNNFYEF